MGGAPKESCKALALIIRVLSNRVKFAIGNTKKKVFTEMWMERIKNLHFTGYSVFWGNSDTEKSHARETGEEVLTKALELEST